MRALATNGKALAMAQPAIASEVHQALDVHRSLAAQVTFYGMVGVNGFADLQHFGVRKILNAAARSEEHTSELQSLMRISYAVFCLKKKKHTKYDTVNSQHK